MKIKTKNDLFRIVFGENPSGSIDFYKDSLGGLFFDDLAKQCIADEATNIFPVCLALDTFPHDCKIILGKPNWKKICKNSLELNKVILSIRFLIKNKDDFIYFINDNMQHGMINIKGVYGLDDINGSFLKSEYVRKFKEWQHFSYSETFDRIMTFRDTIEMAEELGIDFNPNVNWRSIKKHHDQFLKTIQEKNKNLSSSYIPPHVLKIEKKLNQHLPKDKKYDIVILKSISDLVAESVKMKHCLSGRTYINKFISGKFIVIHVSSKEGSGKEIGSTLGISVRAQKDFNDTSINQRTKYLLNQHVLNSNKKIPADHILIKAQREILECLNKTL